MGFYDTLAANGGRPGGSGIYNAGGGVDIGLPERLTAHQAVLDQNTNDWKERQRYTDMMSMRQPRMIAPPSSNNGGMAGGNGGMDVVLNQANQITPFQKAGLDIDKSKLGLEQQKINQTGKIGEERVGVLQANHELNEKKNQNIFDTKTADLQRKHDEAQARLKLAEEALQQRGDNSKETAKYHQAQLDAKDAQHKLEMAQKQAQLDETIRNHDMANKNTDDANALKGRPDVTTTEVSADGTKKTVTKAKGGRVSVTGPNGEKGTVDANEELPKGWAVVK